MSLCSNKVEFSDKDCRPRDYDTTSCNGCFVGFFPNFKVNDFVGRECVHGILCSGSPSADRTDTTDEDTRFFY